MASNGSHPGWSHSHHNWFRIPDPRTMKDRPEEERNNIVISRRKIYVEWMFILLLLWIYLFVAYGIDRQISRRNQTNLVFMLVGLVNILSANVLSN